MKSPAPRIPLNILGIPFGLLGLADAWVVAGAFGLAPVAVGRLLVAVTVIVWAVVVVQFVRGLRANGLSVTGQLTDPVLGPFSAIAVIVPMLSSAEALYPLNHSSGTIVTDAFIVATLLLAGWLVGHWIYGPIEHAKVHPGYFLPSVAGGFVAAGSAALVGQIGLAQLLFGVGMISWLVLGSIVLGRLITGPALPTPLLPTLAIEVAPAGVATFAWFVIDGGQIDLVVRLLAGYGLLMVIAQTRLIPVYLRLKFMPSVWSFTFSWAAVATAGLFWLGIAQPTAWRPEAYLTLGLITALVAAIGLRTVRALIDHQLLGTPTAPMTPAPTSDPTPATLVAS
jgi:tellurite resistance protein